MVKKFYMPVFVLLMSVMLVLSGCNTNKEPKEALRSAAINALKVDSYVQTNQIKIKNLTVDGSAADDEQVGAVLSMLKDAELNIKQIYQRDPMQTEATLEVKLNGDMAMTFTIPFVVTKEKVYVKVPSIPFLPMPEGIVGKFLEIDLKELAEQSGNEFSMDALDTEKSQKLAAEISDAVLGEYDSAKYFKNIDSKDAQLPDGYKAKQVVQFSITNDNVKDAITVLVKNALPKIIDVISKEEYRSMLELSSEDIEEFKEELNTLDDTEMNETLDELSDYLTINTFTLNTAIDKNNYPSHTDLNLDIEIKDPEEGINVAFALQMTSTMTEINKKTEFEIGIPTDTITLDELAEEMGGFGY